jgi:predicted nucleic acid-binding protein
MGKRVYIETSVVSYLVARPSRNLLTAAWQQVTHEWWDSRRSQFELFTSEVVWKEAKRGDPDAAESRCEKLRDTSNLELTDGVAALVRKLIEAGALPAEAIDDATHVAVSAIHEIDYLLTWNCRHLDNAEMKPLMRSVCAVAGHRCPEICTPQELMGEQTDEG